MWYVSHTCNHERSPTCLFVLLFGTFLIFLHLWQVEQACSALSSLAGDVSVAMLLMKCDIMQPIIVVLKSFAPEEVKSVLQVVGQLAFASDTVAQKMLTKDVLKSLKLLCAHKNPEASTNFLVCTDWLCSGHLMLKSSSFVRYKGLLCLQLEIWPSVWRIAVF